MSKILEVSRVEQVFRTGFWMRPTRVLHDVSFEVEKGSVFGFVGANGAGKTTLIHLITGLRKPASGEVRVSGIPISQREARARIGYLPERPYFQEHLTGEQMLWYFGRLSGMPRPSIEARIPEVLKAVRLESARCSELRTYSKGMLQRIGIAQAILHSPELLVLDEPMSGLDPLGRKEMRELILRLSEAGTTIFFSTHVIPDVEALCDEVAVIEKGQIRERGLVSDLLTQDKQGTDVRFTGLTVTRARELVEFERLHETPGEVHAAVGSGVDVNAMLLKLIGGGATIISVSPVRSSLESLFEGRTG